MTSIKAAPSNLLETQPIEELALPEQLNDEAEEFVKAEQLPMEDNGEYEENGEVDETFAIKDEEEETETIGRARVQRTNAAVNEAARRAYELKLKEISIEEELLEAGKHPEYHEKLASLAVEKEQRLKRAADRRMRLIECYEREHAAEVKCAGETLKYKTKELRALYINKLVRQKYNPEKDAQVNERIFQTHPIVLFNNLVYRATHEEDGPEWIQQLVKKRKRNSRKMVIFAYEIFIPQCCVGLDENQVQEDLQFLKQISL